MRKRTTVFVCGIALLLWACDDMLDVERPLYEKYKNRASLMGSAVPGNNWEPDNAALMDTVRSGLYRWTGTLQAGEMKVAWQKPDFNKGEWYMADQPGKLVETNLRSMHTALCPAVYVAIGEASNNWAIAQAGDYRVTLDTAAKTVEFMRVFNAVYLVGDATPGGWEIGSATAMSRLDDGTFTWRGNLNTDGSDDQVKFICKVKGDDALDWTTSPQFVATVADNHFSGAEQDLVPYNPGESVADNKFTVSAAGDWTITCDPYRLKVKAVKNYSP